MPDAADLDHVALAATSSWDLLAVYGGELGGRLANGGPAVGFHFCQVRFANDMRVELLEPAVHDETDFLQRFLDHSGPGPHHLTFKVPDLDATLETVEAAGYSPVSINRENPNWQEAFLHPKSSHGVVIQIAQPGDDGPPGQAEDDVLPPGRSGATASLVRIEHLVADLDAALELFAGPLGGAVLAREQGPDGEHADLGWPGPGRIRLLRPADDDRTTWLGSRSGRIHHVLFRTPHPDRLAAVSRIGPGLWERHPEQNHGTRLRIVSD